METNTSLEAQPGTSAEKSYDASEHPMAEQLGNLTVQSPQFQTFNSGALGEGAAKEISRFADIKVIVSAELGRANIPLEQLLSLGKGSVVELDRSIDSPIELVAQGIPLAKAEVVIVNDCFAVRILEVYPRRRRGEDLSQETNK
ncbi:MAG: FliM/FliN family flagellar motor switch protein [Pirellulaceae bacterium]